MNSVQYAGMISKRFGKKQSDKDDIMNCLVKLIKLSQSEVNLFKSSEKVIHSKTEIRQSIDKLHKYIRATTEESIAEILKTSKTDYDKVLMIIDLMRVLGGEHHISIVPEDMFSIFWGFAENSKVGIIFDIDCQNFQVI